MRKLPVLAASLVGVLGLAAGAVAGASTPPASTIPLPAGAAPEGVVTGRGNEFFVSNLANGSIARGNLKRGTVAPFVTAPALPISVGLAFDKRHDLLFAAGGPTGAVAIYDARRGTTVASPTLTTAPSFINDVITTGDAAYLTNSFAAELYRVPIGRRGEIGAPRTITLSGPAATLVPGINLNGIEATEHGERLIVVNSATGALYSVDPTDGTSITIDLGGASVSSGDGLWLDGDTLYVVRNQLNEVAVFTLDDDAVPTAATLVDTIMSPLLEVPTTVARKGHRLVVVNAQFGLPPTNPFEVVVFTLPDDEHDD